MSDLIDLNGVGRALFCNINFVLFWSHKETKLILLMRLLQDLTATVGLPGKEKRTINLVPTTIQALHSIGGGGIHDSWRSLRQKQSVQCWVTLASASQVAPLA